MDGWDISYNSHSKDKSMDNILKNLDFDLDVWMETGLFNGPDRNWVYKPYNITIENLRPTSNVLITGISFKSVSFMQTLKFKVFLAEKVHNQTNKLRDEMTRLHDEKVTLCRMVMQMQLHWGDPCARLFMSRNPSNLLLLSSVLDLLYLNF